MTDLTTELDLLAAKLGVVGEPDRDLDLRLLNALASRGKPWVWHHRWQTVKRECDGWGLNSLGEYTASIDAACLLVMASQLPFFETVASGVIYARGLKTYLLDPTEYQHVVARCICLAAVRAARLAAIKEPAVA